MRALILAATVTAGLVAPLPAFAVDPPQNDRPTLPRSQKSEIRAPRVDATKPQPNPRDFYTADLKQAGLQGTAVVDVFVLADGTAGEMRISKSSGAEPLDNAAKAVVKRMHFVPGTINGTPSPMWGRYGITFTSDR